MPASCSSSSDDDLYSTRSSTMSSSAISTPTTSPANSRDPSTSKISIHSSHKHHRLDYNVGLYIYNQICNQISTHTPGSFYCPEHEVVCNAGQHPSNMPYICQKCSPVDCQTFHYRRLSFNTDKSTSHRRSSSTPPLNLKFFLSESDSESSSQSTDSQLSRNASNIYSPSKRPSHHPDFRRSSSSERNQRHVLHRHYREPFYDQAARAKACASTSPVHPTYYSSTSVSFHEPSRRSSSFRKQYLQKGRFLNSDYFQADINYDSDSEPETFVSGRSGSNDESIKGETPIKSCLKKHSQKKNRRISLSTENAPNNTTVYNHQLKPAKPLTFQTEPTAVQSQSNSIQQHLTNPVQLNANVTDEPHIQSKPLTFIYTQPSSPIKQKRASGSQYPLTSAAIESHPRTGTPASLHKKSLSFGSVSSSISTGCYVVDDMKASSRKLVYQSLFADQKLRSPKKNPQSPELGSTPRHVPAKSHSFSSTLLFLGLTNHKHGSSLGAPTNNQLSLTQKVKNRLVFPKK